MTNRKNPVPPTRAELRILKALWELKSGTIEEIIRHPSFFLASQLQDHARRSSASWKKKGWHGHTTGGRVFVFEPAVSRDWVEKMCVADHTGAEFLAVLRQNYL